MSREQRPADDRAAVGVGETVFDPSLRESVMDVREMFADALQHHQSGRLAAALQGYRALLRRQPDFADAFCNMGVALKASGRLNEAVAAYRTALLIKQDNAVTGYNLGNALYMLGRLGDAVTAFRAVLVITPNYPEALANQGLALKGLGRLDQAADAYGAALRLRPVNGEAQANRALALHELGRHHEAVAAYRAALCCTPDLSDAHANLGLVLKDLGRPIEAIAAFHAALRIKPDFPEVLCNLGNAMNDLGRPDEAIAALGAALRLKPDFPEAQSSLLMGMHYHSGIGEQAILDAAKRFAAPLEAGFPAPYFARSADTDRRLRIGYVSGDFRRHPVGYFLSRVLANHDPTAVETFCYSNNQQSDDRTLRLRRAANHWRSLVGLSDPAAAALITQDAIDILVDLSGHTAHNRLSLFARRSAPIQVTWLGFWGTTGLSRMDYILSDMVTIPPGEERFYSEGVLRLPKGRFCYDPPETAPSPMPPPALRNRVITFGSFNNLAKIGPAVIAQWSEVLRAVPGSRLLLKWNTLAEDAARDRIVEAFGDHGIAPDRLELRGASSHAEMLAEYGDIDIALDPFPFSGGLTSCEALWMGVPVITLPGASAPSRQTAGILKTLGLPDWIAASPVDMIEIVSSLAADLPRLAASRAALRQKIAASPLCDGPGFTAGLENAYRAMWRAWCDGTATVPD